MEKRKNSFDTASKVPMKFEPYETVEEGLAFLKKKDFKNANDSFKKAAEYGEHEGEFQLGKSYELGRGVEKNKKLARQWYTKAAEDGSAKACNNLGSICWCEEEDYSQALAWFRKGLKIEERATLLYNLGRAYITEGFGLNDPVTAEKYLLRAAEFEYERAYSKLADLYLNDSFPLFDINKSEHWLSKCQDDLEEFELEIFADKFLDDTFPGYSVKKALKYYELAIEKAEKNGYEHDLRNFKIRRTVCLYRMGSIDESKAIRIFRDNAESDEPDSFAVEELIKYYEKKDDRNTVNKWCRVYAEDCVGNGNIKNKYVFMAAENYINAGRFDEAEALYLASTSFNSNAEEIIYAYDKTGDIHMYNMRGCQSAQECRDQAKPFYRLALETCEENRIGKNDSRYIEISSKLVDAERKW